MKTGRSSRQDSVCRFCLPVRKHSTRRWLTKKKRRRPDRVWPSCAKVKGGSCHQRQGERQGAECSHAKTCAFQAQLYGGKRLLSKGQDAIYEGKWTHRLGSRQPGATTDRAGRKCAPHLMSG